MLRFVILMALCLCLPLAAQQAFINEIHYDNSGTDANEGIEIAGAAGTVLSQFDVVFYNGTGGAAYDTISLSGVIPNENGSGFGAVWFAVPGIQNGAPDGMVLVLRAGKDVRQRLAYEGGFTAADGPAAGLALPDIGVAEEPAPAAGQSLQLTGTGSSAADFTWTGPVTASRGLLNAGQTLTSLPATSAQLQITPAIVTEGQSSGATLTLIPAPATPATLTLTTSPAGIVSAPAQVTVTQGGTTGFSLTAIAGTMAVGFQDVILTVHDDHGVYPDSTARLQVIDADRPPVSVPGSLRVMSMNVRFGVDPPGTAEFRAVREIVERLSPDVLLMQEVDGTGNFGDWKTLVQQAGFPGDATHLSISGDAFATQSYQSGEISGGIDQSVVTASRFPVTRRVQMGRGAAGRREVTRFPLLTTVDVPWLSAADDPVLINVHFKADSGDANNFRRALEALRLRQVLGSEGISATSRNVIVAGDCNATDWLPQPDSYPSNSPPITAPGTPFADGTALPASFLAGSDLTANGGLTLTYRAFPHSGLSPAMLTDLGARQADGSDERTFAFASYKLDYIFVSDPIAGRGGPRAEIYNSRHERLHDGLPKQRDLPDPGLSTTASDHFALFADIPLASLPVLSLTFSDPAVEEGDAGVTAIVSVNPAPAAPVIVNLASWRDARLAFASPQLLLSSAQPVATVPLVAPWLPGVEPHRSVTATADAAGCRRATATIHVRNRDAAGSVVISQYTEPSSGSAPRALEIMNVSGTRLDFAVTPLTIRRFTNGDVDGLNDAEAVSGRLPDRAVLVFGDETTGDYLVSQGLLPPPATPFASQDEHTVSLNASGSAAFVLNHFVFNGNDALEVLLDGIRCDVLGDIGHDPGTAWTGPGGESTANQSLALRPAIATGSSGWRQPGRRFISAASGLSGFGVGPVLTDPYLTWAAAAGLTGFDASPAGDPDRDGAVNLLEYGMASDPLSAVSQPAFGVAGPSLTVSRRLRTADATLNFILESTTGAGAWTPAAGSDVVEQTFPDGTQELKFTFTGGAPPRFLRQRVTRP